MKKVILICTFLLLVGLLSCQRGPNPAHSSNNGVSSASTQQVFQVKGIVKKIEPDGKSVEIRHEEIPDYMPAMTMPFDVKNPAEIAGLKPGDAVSFRLTVTALDSWIDQIRPLSSAGTNFPAVAPTSGAAPAAIIAAPEPLQVGDMLPEYSFTNQLGHTVSTKQFKGQALALTFIFTRCPLPNFCPRMSSNFEDVQKKLMGRPNGPTNWHLLTISFDPEFDTPAILKAYADRFNAEPQRWDFLTGPVPEITALSQQFGQTFWREEGALNHNLRTVVINASGRVQNIITGNTWTSDELVEDIVRAAGSG
jgi:protein SCO1/2